MAVGPTSVGGGLTSTTGCFGKPSALGWALLRVPLRSRSLFSYRTVGGIGRSSAITCCWLCWTHAAGSGGASPYPSPALPGGLWLQNPRLLQGDASAGSGSHGGVRAGGERGGCRLSPSTSSIAFLCLFSLAPQFVSAGHLCLPRLGSLLRGCSRPVALLHGPAARGQPTRGSLRQGPLPRPRSEGGRRHRGVTAGRDTPVLAGVARSDGLRRQPRFGRSASVPTLGALGRGSQPCACRRGLGRPVSSL